MKMVDRLAAPESEVVRPRMLHHRGYAPSSSDSWRADRVIFCSHPCARVPPQVFVKPASLKIINEMRDMVKEHSY